MKWPIFSKKIKQSDQLSDFLLNASEEKKKTVFIEAARRANKDQQDLVERSKHSLEVV